MATLREVKAAWTKLSEFRDKNLFIELHAANLTPEDIESLPAVLAARRELNERATALFREIGKKICADNAVPWGARPEGLTDEATLSDEAEEKLSTLLAFIASH